MHCTTTLFNFHWLLRHFSFVTRKCKQGDKIIHVFFYQRLSISMKYAMICSFDNCNCERMASYLCLKFRDVYNIATAAYLSNRPHFLWVNRHNNPSWHVGTTREKLVSHSPPARDLQAFLVFFQHPKSVYYSSKPIENAVVRRTIFFSLPVQ